MDAHTLGKMLAAALVPVFWLVALTLCKWTIRKWKPEWEKTLWLPIGALLRRLFRANRRRA
jgi:hypothetical protein